MDVSRDTPMEGDKVVLSYRMYRYEESKEGHKGDLYESTVGCVSLL